MNVKREGGGGKSELRSTLLGQLISLNIFLGDLNSLAEKVASMLRPRHLSRRLSRNIFSIVPESPSCLTCGPSPFPPHPAFEAPPSSLPPSIPSSIGHLISMLSRLSLLRLRLPSLVRLSSSVPAPIVAPPVHKVQPSTPLSVSDSKLPLDDISPPSVFAQASNKATTWVLCISGFELGKGRKEGWQRKEVERGRRER